MYVCATRESALTGGMPDALTGSQKYLFLDALTVLDMHVQHCPASLLQTIVIQILNNCAAARAHDQPVCHGYYPGIAQHTAESLARWCKIKRGPGRATNPAAVQTTSDCPQKNHLK